MARESSDSEDEDWHTVTGSPISLSVSAVGSMVSQPVAADEFWAGYKPRRQDVFVIVMGMTGSGKSTFVSHFAETGNQPKIGDGLRSCKLALLPQPTANERFIVFILMCDCIDANRHTEDYGLSM